MTTNLPIQARASDLSHINWLKDCQLYDFKNRRVLDLGCGSGFLCQQAVAAGASAVCGIDLVQPQGLSDVNWSFQQVNLDEADWIAQLDPAESKWDLVLAFDILEHVRSPFDFLENIAKALSAEGRLVLTTPITASWERLMRPKSWSGATDPQHKCLFNSYSLQFLVERAGLEVVSLQAPIRKLGVLNRWFGHWGGQMLLVARKPS